MRRALAFLFLVACTSGGGGVDAGNPCPAAIPVRGSPCQPMTNASLCEYRPSDACIMQAFCDVNTFAWRVDGLPGCLPNLSVCPSSFADVPTGTSCTLSASYVCAYGEGNCACEPCAGDAGAQQVWRCNSWASAGAQCPTPRPLAGTACQSELATCDYSQCCTPPSLGPSLQCVSGVWTAHPNVSCKCAAAQCL